MLTADPWWDSFWQNRQRDLSKARKWVWRDRTVCPKVWSADCSPLAITSMLKGLLVWTYNDVVSVFKRCSDFVSLCFGTGSTRWCGCWSMGLSEAQIKEQRSRYGSKPRKKCSIDPKWEANYARPPQTSAAAEDHSFVRVEEVAKSMTCLLPSSFLASSLVRIKLVKWLNTSLQKPESTC